jgi:hypothetical protein
MQLEFITENRISHLDSNEFFDFVIQRVKDDRILVVEKELSHEEKIQLMAKGLEEVSNNTSHGINMAQIVVSSGSTGRLRNRKKEVRFNLFAPGSSLIQQEDEGHYSIVTDGGHTVAVI